MSESFLKLQQKEQAEILNAISTKIGRSALILEKDIWLCWTLEHLFKMPCQLPMAFKGGTSLSKVYGVIQRFSEDVDITIDYQAFNCGNPFANGLSKTQLKKICAQIKMLVKQHIQDVILPYYQQVILDHHNHNAPTLELDDDGETLYLHYPSALEQKSDYVPDSIRLEFGGKNLTIPNNSHTITPDITEHVSELDFPTAQATVLSAQKTFWEKTTLIHYECNRGMFKDDVNRISRHWYDLAMLASHDIGKNALNDMNLLNEVIKVKKTFYDASYAKYDDCINGNLHLIPNDNYLKLLKEDFNKMLSEKMFYSEQPDFDNIIEQISKLEKKINAI